MLHDFGLPVALRALADRSPRPVSVSCKGIGRDPEAIEAALYYCAREAIQNATNHGACLPARSRATVALNAP